MESEQTKLPKPKLYLFLAFFGIAIISTFLLRKYGIWEGDKWFGSLIGITTTFFIVSLAELFPELIRWISEYGNRGKFKRLFGKGVSKDVRLVFARRELNEDALKKDSNPWKMYFKPDLKSNEMALPEGVNKWLAYQDVRASVYISNKIYEMTGKQVDFSLDESVDAKKEFCGISLGLGFNDFTNWLSTSSGLFKIKWDTSPKPDNRLIPVSTNQSVKQLTDLFEIEGWDGKIETGKDVAIVARIVNPNEPEYVWFVCAGRTASGTASAGYYLGKYWKEMFNLYKNEDLDKRSLIVVIEHDEGKYKEKTVKKVPIFSKFGDFHS